MDENIDLSENTKINEALKEFEIKNVEQTEKIPVISKTSEAPKMIQLVMKIFGMREEKQAEYALLGFAVLAIIISLFLIFGGQTIGSSEDIKILPAEF